MEKMVNDPEIHKVACIVDKIYAEKADGRMGGVGTESQIISQKLYSQTKQSKFVAVVRERDEQGIPYLPTYFKTLHYIDLSQEEYYSENYEQLLRWIFDSPLHVKPEIGPKPAFLETEHAIQLGTSVIYKRAIDAIKLQKPQAVGALKEYLRAFSENLERFRINEVVGEYDDIVIKNIDEFIPYRNEFIQLLITLCHYPLEDTADLLNRFFEQLIPYLSIPRDNKPHKNWDIDNLKFIIHELFLYAIGVPLKHECFDVVAALISQDYYLDGSSGYGDQGMVSYGVFRDFLDSFKYRNHRLNLNRISLRADLLEQRSHSSGISFRYLMQADFVLFMRAEITQNCQWWPETLLYIGYDSKPFELFVRAESEKYFNKIKSILNINAAGDLQALMTAYTARSRQVPSWDFTRVYPPGLMAYDKLATKP